MTEDQGGAKGIKEPDGAGGTRCSWRSGVPTRRMIDTRPRRSRRDEGAQRSQWTARPRQSVGSYEPWWSCWVDVPRRSPGLRCGVQGFEAETKGTPATVTKEDGPRSSHRTGGGLRVSRGAARQHRKKEAGAGICETPGSSG